MNRTTRSLLAAAAAVSALLIASCSSSTNGGGGRQSSSTPTGPVIPAPIGDLSTFLAGIDSAGGCSTTLVKGVTDGLSAINEFGTNNFDGRVGGTAKITNHTGRTIEGVPACEFTLDPGNTVLSKTLIIGGLTAQRNTLLSTPTQATMEPEVPTSSSAPAECMEVGIDKVGAAITSILKTNHAELTDCAADNRSSQGSYAVSTHEVSAAGKGGYFQAAPGFFTVAIDKDAARDGLTSALSGVFANWIERGPDAGHRTDFSLTIA